MRKVIQASGQEVCPVNFSIPLKLLTKIRHTAADNQESITATITQLIRDGYRHRKAGILEEQQQP